MNCPYCIKVCTKCGEILVANSMNFKRQKDGKFGLTSRCKRCDKEYYRKWSRENDEHLKKYNKKYYEENKNLKKEYDKKYYEKNKEKIKERTKKYKEENKEYYKEYYEKWRVNNPEKEFNNHAKRRQLEENQGNGISKEQWLEMMIFFEWKCAYSGEYIGGNSDKRTIDHIIPLDKGGEHEVWNCVPMYANYNYSKRNNDMLEWYMQQEFFDIDRLRKIFEWRDYAFRKWENQ